MGNEDHNSASDRSAGLIKKGMEKYIQKIQGNIQIKLTEYRTAWDISHPRKGFIRKKEF